MMPRVGDARKRKSPRRAFRYLGKVVVRGEGFTTENTEITKKREGDGTPRRQTSAPSTRSCHSESAQADFAQM